MVGEGPKLDGEPDGSLLCPDEFEAAENYMTDGGEHIAVYEAQCARVEKGAAEEPKPTGAPAPIVVSDDDIPF